MAIIFIRYCKVFQKLATISMPCSGSQDQPTPYRLIYNAILMLVLGFWRVELAIHLSNSIISDIIIRFNGPKLGPTMLFHIHKFYFVNASRSLSAYP